MVWPKLIHSGLAGKIVYIIRDFHLRILTVSEYILDCLPFHGLCPRFPSRLARGLLKLRGLPLPSAVKPGTGSFPRDSSDTSPTALGPLRGRRRLDRARASRRKGNQYRKLRER